MITEVYRPVLRKGMGTKGSLCQGISRLRRNCREGWLCDESEGDV
jgi:hypothetical protein